MLFLGATTKQQWHQLQQIQCHHELSVESFFFIRAQQNGPNNVNING